MNKLVRKFCIILSTILIFPLCSFFGGCNQKGLYSENLFCFGTPIKIVTEGKIPTSLLTSIAKNINALEREFSTDNGTFTTQFNSANENQPIEISSIGKAILQASFVAYEFTDRKFNPAIYPLVKLWGFSPDFNGEFAIPAQNDIDQILLSNALDLNNVILSEQIVYKTNQSTMLDFGGILKGYAVDYIADTLYANRFTTGFVNIGSSSLKILGADTLSIRHPSNTYSNIVSINCFNQPKLCVSTSGTYERTHSYEGKTYSHIIDGESGYALENTGVVSATITGVDGIYADAFTTALCLSDYNPQTNSGELIDLMNKISAEFPFANFYVVYQKGDIKQIISNQKEGRNFTLLDSNYTAIKF